MSRNVLNIVIRAARLSAVLSFKINNLKLICVFDFYVNLPQKNLLLLYCQCIEILVIFHNFFGEVEIFFMGVCTAPPHTPLVTYLA